MNALYRAAQSLSTWLRPADPIHGLGVPLLLGIAVYNQRVQEAADPETRAANTARSRNQHAARTIEVIDAYLRAIASLIGSRAVKANGLFTDQRVDNDGTVEKR